LALARDGAAAAATGLREEALLTALLLLGGLGVLIREGPRNTQAIGWAAVLVLLALPWGLKLGARRLAGAAGRHLRPR
jgi:hypothetical protein